MGIGLAQRENGRLISYHLVSSRTFMEHMHVRQVRVAQVCCERRLELTRADGREIDLDVTSKRGHQQVHARDAGVGAVGRGRHARHRWRSWSTRRRAGAVEQASIGPARPRATTSAILTVVQRLVSLTLLEAAPVVVREPVLATRPLGVPVHFVRRGRKARL